MQRSHKKLVFDDKNIRNEKIKTLETKEEIIKLATKAELKADKIVQLQTYDRSAFVGQSYFTNDGGQLYIIFQPIYKTITKFLVL